MTWAGKLIIEGERRNACVLVGEPAVVKMNTLEVLGIYGWKYCLLSYENALDLMRM
jgi:hypothetical protein